MENCYRFLSKENQPLQKMFNNNNNNFVFKFFFSEFKKSNNDDEFMGRTGKSMNNFFFFYYFFIITFPPSPLPLFFCFLIYRNWVTFLKQKSKKREKLIRKG